MAAVITLWNCMNLGCYAQSLLLCFAVQACCYALLSKCAAVLDSITLTILTALLKMELGDIYHEDPSCQVTY